MIQVRIKVFSVADCIYLVYKYFCPGLLSDGSLFFFIYFFSLMFSSPFLFSTHYGMIYFTEKALRIRMIWCDPPPFFVGNHTQQMLRGCSVYACTRESLLVVLSWPYRIPRIIHRQKQVPYLYSPIPFYLLRHYETLFNQISDIPHLGAWFKVWFWI